MTKRTVVIALFVGALAAWIISAPARTGAHPGALTADGGRYFGKLANGKLHGQGRIEWENGAFYEGEFAEGLYSGRGRLRLASGDVYEGQFKKGLMEGPGRTRYSDGDTYAGEFRSGRMHGKGRYEDARGDVYEGEFDKDKFAGQGLHIRKGGGRHEGRFANWQPEGPGRHTDAMGRVYEGEFANGELNGRGRSDGKAAGRYEGEFKNWLFHGQGVLYLPNGDVYRGGFADGLYDGEGTLTYAKPIPGGRTQERGIWRNGELEDAAREKLDLANSEAALYNQRALLDKALSAIEARDAGKINLYMLSVAGEGTQEVFRREVDFVTDLFGRQFGIKGRALALVNSRNTVATHPMATATSIREALQGIARRMDRQKDILFLFITSHGSKEHEISLGQEKIKLRGLPAQDLGQMLKETGITWKVILISACYSGGFIDALKDDHTLIMTAARRDRTSFGCADENDFTYFGRAFFKESLPASTSFQDAFQRAEKLVREWERKDLSGNGRAGEEEYSLPQIFNPAPAERYLRRWWAQVQASARAPEGRAAR